jgi:hypothetical protein
VLHQIRFNPKRRTREPVRDNERMSTLCYSEDVRLQEGPVAQLGARFHGMEEVESSNLSRSTKLQKRFLRRFRL